MKSREAWERCQVGAFVQLVPRLASHGWVNLFCNGRLERRGSCAPNYSLVTESGAIIWVTAKSILSAEFPSDPEPGIR